MNTISKKSSDSIRTYSIWACIILLIALVIYIAYHSLNHSSPSLAAEMDLGTHPIPAWVTADADKCNGDISKLSPAEQQKLAKLYPGPGARMEIMAAYSLHH